MAQQRGLFTGGTSVEELLADRRERSNALRTSLAANAAQGARNAPRAQTASMMGSIVADLIGRKMGGGDAQMEKLEADNASQEDMQQQYGSMSQGTAEQQHQLAINLNNAGYYKEAAQAKQSANVKAQQEVALEQSQADQVKAKEEQDSQERSNNRIADLVFDDIPTIAANAREGDPIALKAAYAWQAKKMSSKGEKASGTAAEQNYKALTSISSALTARSELDPEDPSFLNPSQLASQQRTASNVFGVGDSSYQKKMGEGMAAQIVKLTGDNNANLEADNDARTLIDSSLSLLDSGDLYTGAGGEAYLGLQKVLSAFGAPVDLTSMAAGEAFRSKAMSFVLQYVAQTKGAISNAEMKKFEAAAMGLGNTELGNRLILDVARQANDFKRNQATYMGDWFDKKSRTGVYPTPNEYSAEQRAWQDANRIIPKTPAEIKALAEGMGVTTGTGEIVVANDALSSFNDLYDEDPTND